jgi:hypothetical protein
VYSSSTTIARSRGFESSVARTSARCSSTDSAPRRALRQRLARHLRGPQAEEAIEVIDRCQRQVHRGCTASLVLRMIAGSHLRSAAA